MMNGNIYANDWLKKTIESKIGGDTVSSSDISRWLNFADIQKNDNKYFSN